MIRTVKRGNGFRKYWADSTGRAWNGNQCGSCFAKAYGRRPDDVAEPRWQKGMRAERLVAKFFDKLKISYRRTEMFGPDFQLEIFGVTLSAEVKSTREYISKDGSKRICISRPTKKRERDDLLVCVHNSEIRITSMKAQMARSSPQNVTHLFV